MRQAGAGHDRRGRSRLKICQRPANQFKQTARFFWLFAIASFVNKQVPIAGGRCWRPITWHLPALFLLPCASQAVAAPSALPLGRHLTAPSVGRGFGAAPTAHSSSGCPHTQTQKDTSRRIKQLKSWTKKLKGGPSGAVDFVAPPVASPPARVAREKNPKKKTIFFVLKLSFLCDPQVRGGVTRSARLWSVGQRPRHRALTGWLTAIWARCAGLGSVTFGARRRPGIERRLRASVRRWPKLLYARLCVLGVKRGLFVQKETGPPVAGVLVCDKHRPAPVNQKGKK